MLSLQAWMIALSEVTFPLEFNVYYTVETSDSIPTQNNNFLFLSLKLCRLSFLQWLRQHGYHMESVFHNLYTWDVNGMYKDSNYEETIYRFFVLEWRAWLPLFKVNFFPQV